MSTTLNRQHLQLLDRTAELAVADLTRLWRALPRTDIDRLVDALVELVPGLAARWGDVASVGASDYFDAVREFYNPGGSYLARPGAPAPVEQVQASTRWAVGPLFQASPDEAATLARLASSLDRLVRGADRDTIAGNATRDRRALGYRRVARPGACAFCLMLATRDDYSSQAAASAVGAGQRGRIRGNQSAGSRYHDNCRCFAAPVYAGWEPDADVQRALDLYDRAGGDIKQMRRLLAET
ncbi:hypothetical protein [Nocardiopsis eucommiae]|uniref:VG15 protein n=1 Tax=Nocardiopsis eucommiae TaxID=2831970 RepID=UPI003D71D920